jgi:hypothetical protein
MKGNYKMKTQPIKVMLAGLLAVPMLAFSVGLLAPMNAAADPVNCDPTKPTVTSGASCSQGSGQKDDLFGTGGIFTTIANTALFIIGAISVLMLIYGGIRYTVSGGNEKSVTAAKNTIMYAVIGVVVALLAFAIINFVLTSLISSSSSTS